MKKVVSIAAFGSGLIVIFTPLLIFPVCELQGYKRMACSYTGATEVVLGFLILFLSGAIFFLRNKIALRWSCAGLMLVGLSVVFIPDVIGYCHSSRMPCNYATVPALRLEGAIVSILGLAGIIFMRGEDV